MFIIEGSGWEGMGFGLDGLVFGCGVGCCWIGFGWVGGGTGFGNSVLGGVGDIGFGVSSVFGVGC